MGRNSLHTTEGIILELPVLKERFGQRQHRVCCFKRSVPSSAIRRFPLDARRTTGTSICADVVAFGMENSVQEHALFNLELVL